MTKKPKTIFKSVMLVDDNEIDNFINQKMLEGCGFAESVFVHTSSKSALEFLNNLVRNYDSIPEHLIPGVIFLDINMPIMDGFQFVEKFAELPADFRNKINIVMLSTSINPNDALKSNDNPYILCFLNKPLNQKYIDEISAMTGHLNEV